MQIIAFTDNETFRRDSNVLAFKDLPETTVVRMFRTTFETYNFDRKIWESYSWDGKGSLIRFRHNREPKQFSDASLKVCYGGATESASGGEFRIYRPIVDKDFITPVEARDLIDFAKNRSRSVPNLLLSQTYDRFKEVQYRLISELQSPFSAKEFTGFPPELLQDSKIDAAWEDLKAAQKKKDYLHNFDLLSAALFDHSI